MNQERFPSKYNWLAIAPAAVLAITYGLNLLASAFDADINESGIAYGFYLSIAGGIISAAAIIVLYVLQVRFIKRVYPSKKLWVQALLIGGSLMGITMGGLSGDFSGAAAFNDSPDPLGTLAVGLYALPFTAAVAYGCVLSNLIFIKTKGMATWLKVINVILYWLAWIAIAVLSYLAYAITYSLHDPSTE
jgi:hypothetical protein